MKRKIFVAAMAAVTLIACERNEVDVPAPAEGETVMLEVKVNSGMTKVSGEGGDEEKAVSDYQVLVYDMSSRSLESYETPAASADEVEIRCRLGLKEIVVLANAPDVSDVISYDDFLKKRSSLEDNAVGKLVMEGHTSLDLGASGGSVTVDLRRLASKVILDGITVDFEQDAYDDMDFILKRVYLTNVAGDMTYMAETADPAQWYNKIVQKSDAKVDGMILDSFDGINMKGRAGYSSPHHFYCYPNPYQEDSFSATQWSPRPTRLVVEAELGETTYYYPVSLPVLERNNRYHVTLHIVRPGTMNPEQDMDKQTGSFTINILGWQGETNVSETI